jgi:hypothetical protein
MVAARHPHADYLDEIVAREKQAEAILQQTHFQF